MLPRATPLIATPPRLPTHTATAPGTGSAPGATRYHHTATPVALVLPILLHTSLAQPPRRPTLPIHKQAQTLQLWMNRPRSRPSPHKTRRHSIWIGSQGIAIMSMRLNKAAIRRGRQGHSPIHPLVSGPHAIYAGNSLSPNLAYIHHCASAKAASTKCNTRWLNRTQNRQIFWPRTWARNRHYALPAPVSRFQPPTSNSTYLSVLLFVSLQLYTQRYECYLIQTCNKS